MRCVLGRNGVSTSKREGDGATPVGEFGFRRVLYRPDREAVPPTRLPCSPIALHDGWCDDPVCVSYNQPVRLPHGGSHERMWRADSIYDLVVVIGFNDTPVIPGAGSAVFIHLTDTDGAPTDGCVALQRDDLLHVLANAGLQDRLRVVWGDT